MLIFYSLFFTFVIRISSLSCLNGNGNAVDWYILYKVPNATKEMTKLGSVKNNQTFYYLDNTNPVFVYRNYSVKHQEGNPLFYTLQQIYAQNPLNYSMYNDQPPGHGGGRTYGHTKGAYAFDEESGFWIISSIPKFPKSKSNGYWYGESQLKFGQIVLCVTVSYDFLQDMKEIFSLTRPYFYDGESPNIPNKEKYLFGIEQISTSGGQELNILFKSSSFNADLYESHVFYGLGDSMCVLTYQANLASTNNVLNIEEVSFRDGYRFPATRDHSKWAVTRSKNWTCIGDINRTTTQFKRGGLTVCLHHNTVAKEFRSISDCRRKMRENETSRPAKTCDNKKKGKKGKK